MKTERRERYPGSEATIYTSLHIENFRGLRDLVLNDLGRVNLIVGANNVGKTSVLEALRVMHAHLDGYDLSLLVESRGYRLGESLDGSLSALVSFEGGEGFVVSGRRCDGAEATVRGFRRIPNDPPRTNLQGWFHAGFDLMRGRESLQLYCQLQPTGGTITETPNVSQARLPLSLGEARAFPRPYPRGPFGEMVYATTHGWECVVAAVKAFAGAENDPRLHRIYRRNGSLSVITYDHERAVAAATGFVEVR